MLIIPLCNPMLLWGEGVEGVCEIQTYTHKGVYTRNKCIRGNELLWEWREVNIVIAPWLHINKICILAKSVLIDCILNWSSIRMFLFNCIKRFNNILQDTILHKKSEYIIHSIIYHDIIYYKYLKESVYAKIRYRPSLKLANFCQ